MAALAVAAALLVASPAAYARPKPLPREFHSCGDTIVRSFRLLNNMECTLNGLTINASNITIDLGGHRISGDGGASDIGIRVQNPVGGVRIKHGVIASFGFGVQLNSSNNNVVSNTMIERSTQNGIAVILSDGNRFLNNTFVANSSGSTVFLENGSDNNVISGNRFYSGLNAVALNGAATPGNEVKKNLITNNRIIGTSTTAISIATGAISNVVSTNTVLGANGAAVAISSGATGTKILANTLRGDSEGVSVGSAGTTIISGNTVTGSQGRGIDLSTSPGVKVIGNVVRANFADGIALDSGATGATIKGNTVLENGVNGILSFASDGVVTQNVANRNGFKNGLPNTSAYGVSAGTAHGNSAGGNASGTAMGQSQCAPTSACTDAHLSVPPLVTCGSVSQSITLHNPLDCPSGDALAPNQSGLTLNLGFHRVSGGPNAGTDASVDGGSFNNIAVIGGVLADSGDGVILNGQNESVTGSLIIDPSGAGIAMNGVTNSTFTRNTVTRQGGFPALDFINGSGNAVSSSNFVGMSDGVKFEKGAQNNVVRSSTIAACTIGIQATNATTASFPSGTAIRTSRILGSSNMGIFLFNTDSFDVTGNVIQGSGSSSVNDGIFLSGDNTATTNGSNDATIADDHITASALNGVVVTANSNNDSFLSNVVSANDVAGIEAASTTTGTSLFKNVTNENGLNGVEVDGTAPATANKNVADTNGFLAAPNSVDDNTGLGILGNANVTGANNIAIHNDDPNECQPTGLCA